MCLTNVIDCLRHEHAEHCPTKSRSVLAADAVLHRGLTPVELIEVAEILRSKADEAD